MSKLESKLVKDSKAFQVLRLVNAFSLRGGCTREFDGKGQLLTEFWERCYRPEFSHCIDRAYLIEICCEIRRPSLQRSASQHGEWVPMPFDQKYLSQPLLLLFCSSFNEAMDKDFRDALRVGNHSVVLEAASFYLYENELSNPEKAKLPTRGYYDAVVMFQIANNILVKNITNPRSFFSDDLFATVEPAEKINTVNFGLLKGNLEGFIVFRCMGTDSNEVLWLLQSYLENNRGWLGNISAINAFLCRPTEEKLWDENDKFMAAAYQGPRRWEETL